MQTAMRKTSQLIASSGDEPVGHPLAAPLRAGREMVFDFLTAGCESTTTLTESFRKSVKVLGEDYQVGYGYRREGVESTVNRNPGNPHS